MTTAIPHDDAHAAAFERYMHGDCDLFALATHAIRGWPIVVDLDQDGAYRHVLLECSPGTLFDVSGRRPRLSDADLSEYHGEPGSYRTVDRGWLMTNLPARQRADLSTRLTQATHAAHDRLSAHHVAPCPQDRRSGETT